MEQRGAKALFGPERPVSREVARACDRCVAEEADIGAVTLDPHAHRPGDVGSTHETD